MSSARATDDDDKLAERSRPNFRLIFFLVSHMCHTTTSRQSGWGEGGASEHLDDGSNARARRFKSSTSSLSRRRRRRRGANVCLCVCGGFSIDCILYALICVYEYIFVRLLHALRAAQTSSQPHTVAQQAHGARQPYVGRDDARRSGLFLSNPVRGSHMFVCMSGTRVCANGLVSERARAVLAVSRIAYARAFRM